MWSPNQSLNQNPTAENLAKDERISHQTAEVDQSKWKLWLIAGLNILSGFAFSYFLKDFFATHSTQILYFAVAALFVFTILAVLKVFFIKSFKRISLIILLELVALVIPFREFLYPYPSLFFGLGLVLFFVFMAGAYQKSRKILENSLKIHFFTVAYKMIAPTMTAVLLFSSLIFFVNYFERGVKDDALGKEIFAAVFTGSDKLIQFWVPEFSENMTAGEFINALAKVQLAKLGAPAGNAAIAEVSRQLTATFEKSIGTINQKLTVMDAAYDSMVNYYNSFSEGMKLLIGAGVVLLLFFTLKGFAVLTYWLVALIAYFIYKVTIIFGFAYIGSESRSREFVVLP